MRPTLDRRRAVLGALGLGALALAATAATWVRATTSSALQDEVVVSVSGSDAAAGSAAGALVVLAAALAMALGGRWGARAAGLGVALGGLLVAVSGGAVLADPTGPASTAAQQAVGVSTLAGDPTTTPAVWVALLAGVLAVLLGVLAVVVAGGWTRGVRRHDRQGSLPPVRAQDPDAPLADQDAWDALTRGEDPT